jgi:hypothetical protein
MQMPYVEVWVDDTPCDGLCSGSKEAELLDARINEAVTLMRQGYYDAALHALTGDHALCVKSPSSLEAEYKNIKEGRSRDFRLYSELHPVGAS